MKQMLIALLFVSAVSLAYSPPSRGDTPVKTENVFFIAKHEVYVPVAPVVIQIQALKVQYLAVAEVKAPTGAIVTTGALPELKKLYTAISKIKARSTTNSPALPYDHGLS